MRGRNMRHYASVSMPVRRQAPCRSARAPSRQGFDGPQPMKGISHVTFVVRDLDRMATLLCDGLGAREVYDSSGRNFSLSREKFFVLGGVWLVAMEGDPPPARSYQHLAFEVGESD